MSEYRLKVSVEEMQETIGKFTNAKDQLAAAYGQMAAEVMALNSSWNGQASEAFVNRFSELTANIKTSDATMEQAITGLKTAAEIYEEVTADVSGMWSGAAEANPFNG
ncbi:MAG: WXG100 family type VII secretion target [Clostridia bacterium]|nr:WXG100 family type VII secretion target [Clostridia bacterium]